MEKKWSWTGLTLVGAVLCPVCMFILTESYSYNPFADMKPVVWALNLLFYWLFAVCLIMVVGRVRAALRILTVFFMLAGLANYYVIAFRSSPILPWDIFSARTAVSVADNFSYALPGRVRMVLLGFAGLLAAQHIVRGRIENRRVRVAGTAVSLFCIGALALILHQETVVSGLRLYDKMFTPGVVQKRNGSVVAFVMELKYLLVEKPAGYDAETCRALLAGYGPSPDGPASGGTGLPSDGSASVGGAGLPSDGSASVGGTGLPSDGAVSVGGAGLPSNDAVSVGYGSEQGGDVFPGSGMVEMPHIIVIMDEAFADMASLGELSCNADYMPFYHSMQGAEDTVTGTLHVSVLGGNTANTEFEFLTGATMAFLPGGSVPYQQYIRGRIPSLASSLKQRGYRCIAMHPYHAGGWSRNQVYPWMGFDELRFLPDYTDVEYVRKYVSDASDFRQIIKEYEKHKETQDGPLFLFNVTMQNHGGYDQEFTNFTPHIQEVAAESRVVDSYLSLISLTDEALGALLAYFEQEQEHTMIVFFGDHQPNDTVAGPIWRSNGFGKDSLTLEQEAARYEVPFLIWANFDIEEASGLEISANYLAAEVLRRAGFSLSGYYAYLNELQGQYPVISAKQVVDAAGNRLTAEERQASDALLTFQALQYYRLFEQGNGR